MPCKCGFQHQMLRYKMSLYIKQKSHSFLILGQRRHFRSKCATSGLTVPFLVDLTNLWKFLSVSATQSSNYGEYDGKIRKLGKKKRIANLAHLAFSVKRSRFQHFLRHVYTFLESSDQDELNAVPLSYAALVFAEKKRIMHVCTFLTFLTDITSDE